MRSRLLPYLQSAPASLWLAAFFVVPLVSIASISLMTGNSIEGYNLTWNFSVYPDAVDQYSTQLLRSFLYGGISTALALVAMYPVAYWIAFRAGRRKNLFLFLLLLPTAGARSAGASRPTRSTRTLARAGTVVVSMAVVLAGSALRPGVGRWRRLRQDW